MANLTNMYRAGDDLVFSVSITDSRRILIPDTSQTIEISVQQILPNGTRGLFWDFGANSWTLATEPTLENVPETDLAGPTNTGQYEITLPGAYSSGLNDVFVHLKGTGKDKSDFYYRDHIDNGELLNEIIAEIDAAETAILDKISAQGFRRETPSRQDILDTQNKTLRELRDVKKTIRRLNTGDTDAIQ